MITSSDSDGFDLWLRIRGRSGQQRVLGRHVHPCNFLFGLFLQKVYFKKIIEFKKYI
jgi:hypothetical protein